MEWGFSELTARFPFKLALNPLPRLGHLPLTAPSLNASRRLQRQLLDVRVARKLARTEGTAQDLRSTTSFFLFLLPINTGG